MPPTKKATALAPFLMKTPEQIPQTVPNVSSYTLTDDDGGGGIESKEGSFWGDALTGACYKAR